MSDKLKEFVSERRQDFDASEPGTGLWEKIDAQLEVRQRGRISSKWLSAFRYLGFSASILLIALYFIRTQAGTTPASHLPVKQAHSVIPVSAQAPGFDQSKTQLAAAEDHATKQVNALAEQNIPVPSLKPVTTPVFKKEPGQEDSTTKAQDSVFHASPPGALPDAPQEEMSEQAVPEKNGNVKAIKTKKAGIPLPEEPEQLNTYTGTLYDAASLCAVLRAYKFPGKVGMSELRPYKLPGKVGMHLGSWNDDHVGNGVTIKTISCSRLEKEENITAVWLSGKTEHELTVSVKRKFKNVVLRKADGRLFYPIAMSHYYPGLGAISEYGGNLKMVFKSEVGLILFFKNAEEGDTLVIEDVLEAPVKTARP